MRNEQRGSQARPGVKKGRYAKNRLMIGESKPNFMTKLDSRDSSAKLSQAGADWGNFVIDQMPDNAQRFVCKTVLNLSVAFVFVSPVLLKFTVARKRHERNLIK